MADDRERPSFRSVRARRARRPSQSRRALRRIGAGRLVLARPRRTLAEPAIEHAVGSGARHAHSTAAPRSDARDARARLLDSRRYRRAQRLEQGRRGELRPRFFRFAARTPGIAGGATTTARIRTNVVSPPVRMQARTRRRARTLPTTCRRQRTRWPRSSMRRGVASAASTSPAMRACSAPSGTSPKRRRSSGGMRVNGIEVARARPWSRDTISSVCMRERRTSSNRSRFVLIRGPRGRKHNTSSDTTSSPDSTTNSRRSIPL